MKKLTATLSLCALACLFATNGEICADATTSSSDLVAKAQSLKDSAHQQLSAMKSSTTTTAADTDHAKALQAQKTAADIAVKAHATAAEWTNHASVIAQSADKLNPAPAAKSSPSAQPTSTQLAPASTVTSSSSKTKSK